MFYRKFKLSASLAEQLPKRLHDNVIFATFYPPNRREKQILLLTKLLEVLDIKSGEIIRAIDLSSSKLADLRLQECAAQSSEDVVTTSCERTADEVGSLPQPFKFGKFIHFEGSIKHFYILLQVFDKLVVLERCQLEFKLNQQYDNIDRFEITDPHNSFQPKVNIVLKSGDTELFKGGQLEIEVIDVDTEERVEKSKIVLSVNKSFTKKEYINLKNILTFGPNHVRSLNLEEKQPLRQCGDVWMKIFDDNFVIGLPIKNSCNERPTTLENVRVVLICPETEATQYEYTLFQLLDDSCTYENFEKFLRCETEVNSLKFQEEWLPVKDRVLHPKCSGVIVLRMKWEIDMLPRASSYLVFVLYDITAKEKTFTQQYRMKDIVIKPEHFFRDEYKVKFKEIELYQDLLVVSASFFQKGIEIEYQSGNLLPDIISFLNYELGFTCIGKYRGSSEPMELDDPLCQQSCYAISREEMYLNKENVCSFWYGTLLRLQTSEKNIIAMKIYTKSEDKVLMLVRLLYKNMRDKIKIRPVCYTNKGNAEKICELQDKLRMELKLATDFCENNENGKLLKRSGIFKFQQELLAKELESDLAIMNFF